MTQYLMAVHTVDGAPEPTPEQMEKIYKDVDTFNTKLQDLGKWVFAGGLHPASTATVVSAEKGDIVISDGPFAEAKEQLGGFWVIEATDLDEAITLATEASTACQGPVELRPFQDEPEA